MPPRGKENAVLSTDGAIPGAAIGAPASGPASFAH